MLPTAARGPEALSPTASGNRIVPSGVPSLAQSRKAAPSAPQKKTRSPTTTGEEAVTVWRRTAPAPEASVVHQA